MRRKLLGVGAVIASTALALSACGGGASEGAGWNAAVDEVVNKSDEKGGTLKMAVSDDWDSPDPGNTYYAWSWNFSRFYARTLLTPKQAPGGDAQELVPDLAKSLGEVSDDGLTWTYELKEGVKFQDGSEITAEDIKYSIARSNYAPGVLNFGPSYFNAYLEETDYEGPYKDDDLGNFESVTTEGKYTIKFHLEEPFSEFDQLAALSQTAPVPAEADTGDQYGTEFVSSGPYKLEGKYEPGTGMTLVRNDKYDPETDPLVRNRPDKITVKVGQNAEDIDNRLMNGDLHVAAAGTGVQPAARTKILQNEQLKSHADNPRTSFMYYFALNTQVEPLDDKACREAVQFAADKVAMQTAWGGPTSGAIATSLMPPVLPAYEEIDPYKTPEHKGDKGKAEAKLEECGKADGFETNIAYRSDRPREEKIATALQQSLKKVGIKTDLKGYPSGTYVTEQAGSPDFVHQNELGIMFYGWGPDWPSGFGFFSQIVDGRNIADSGNNNIMELENEKIGKLLDEAITSDDAQLRKENYREIDKLVMESATVLPVVNTKALLYRPEELANVYYTGAYYMYDYSALGVAQEE